MALVLLVIQDKADGSIDVSLSTEPIINGMVSEEFEATPAQALGAQVLNLIHSNLHTQHGGIVLVGQDEMPLN